MSRSSVPCSPGDAELVARAVNGDKNAFAELVTRHRPLVAGLTRRVLVDHHLAADAVQEAVVVALVSLRRLRDPDRFGPWLCGIALNVARRWLRQTRTVDSLSCLDVVDDARRPDDLAEASMIAEQVRDAVDGLPPGQRHATLLFYLQGLSYRETAAELQISVGAVKSRLHQARSALAPRFTTDPALQEVPPMSNATTPAKSWVEVSVADVRAGGEDPGHRLHVAVLQDDAGRQLPIWIGPSEATSLAISLEAEEMPRPLTYEFAAGLLQAASAQVIEIRVTQLVGGIYYAVVVIDGPAGRHELDARPSDALNLAVIANASIRVAAEILNDPDATNRPEWKNYTDSAPQLVREMRQDLERLLSPPDEDRANR